MKLGLGGIGEAFRDENFRRYSLGSILSWISYFVQAVAVSWTTWELTHSTRWLAIVVLLDAAPNVMLMPLGGVIADRFDRFRVLLLSYGLAWLQAVALTWLSWTGQLTIERMATLAFLHGAIHAFSIPAQYGLLPRFVERKRLASAISVAAAYTQLAVFAGPALAGWLILHFGVVSAYASNVVGYGVFFAFVASLRTPDGYVQPPASGKSFVGDFLEGLDAIRAHHGILALLALLLLGDALYAAIYQMAPAIADRNLSAGVEGLSAMLASAGAGATIAALWLAHGGAARATPAVVLRAFCGFIVGVVMLSQARGQIVGSIAMFFVGASYETCRTGSVALTQIAIPDALRGRVMSTRFLMLRGAGALGVVATGAAADGFGLRTPLLAGRRVGDARLRRHLFRSRADRRCVRRQIELHVDGSRERFYQRRGCNTEMGMATKVTVKGQVTLPKSVREAAGIRPGDRVHVRARAEGGVIIESAEPSDASDEEYLRRLEDMSRRKPFEGFTTEEVMAMTRSEV